MKPQKSNLGKISIECMMNSSNNNGLETMKVTSLELKDVGGIPYLKLENIDPKMNIICGENGVGKTNILDSIAYMFSAINRNSISLRKGAENGHITIETNFQNFERMNRAIMQYGPIDRYIDHRSDEVLDKLLYLQVNRVFKYKKEHNISVDKDPLEAARSNTAGVTNEDLKNWLVIRKGFAKDNLTKTQQQNADLATRCFSILNPEYSFSSVGTNFEVYIKSPTSNDGEIHFEFLSSGFKSTLFILLGIIKELDLRFKDKIAAEDYEGIILIDEIELHLHPEWQGRICAALKEVFPKAQFFLTTHSPHVVQTARHGEVIALERKDGEVIRRELPTSEYGYQGWTVEEILEDVMGMPDLRTKKYNETKKRFDAALDSQNKHEAQAAYDELDKMLHPHYPLRPVFRMQLDSLGE